MKQKMFAIYDSKGEFYSQPFCQKTMGMAIRAFRDTALDASTTIHAHPEDFTLYCIGEYDDRNGTVEATPLTAIMRANEGADEETDE